MLEIRNLHAGYPGCPVLSNFSLSLPAGSLTAVIGPNGSGKSTLLKAMAGFLPVSGDISFKAEALHTLSDRERAKKIAFLPQSRPIPQLTVRRFVLHGRFPYLSYPRQYRKTDFQAADAALERMGISHLSHRTLSSLSGGERQKVYIAMVLAQGSPIVLMDEPTAALDISHKFELLHLAKQMTQEGKTLILVLHELDLALSWADQVVLLNKGTLRACGTAESLLRSGLLEEVFHILPQHVSTEYGDRYLFHPVSSNYITNNSDFTDCIKTDGFFP